jgi:hypothetical protein
LRTAKNRLLRYNCLDKREKVVPEAKLTDVNEEFI